MPPSPFRIGLLALILVAVASASGSSVVWDSLEEEAETPKYPQTMSVGVPSGLLFGGLGATVEYLLGYRHGLLAEGSFDLLGPSAGSWAAGTGYRFHFRPGLDGPFLGLFLRRAGVRTEIPLDESPKMTYDLEADLLLAGANLGYRWMSAKGWNAVVRGGFGNPVESEIRWGPTEPKDKDQKELIESFMGLDLEFTVGYAF
jgi:hypothetical protein